MPKMRRVVLTLELETDLPLKALRRARDMGLTVHFDYGTKSIAGDDVQEWYGGDSGTILQAQANNVER